MLIDKIYNQEDSQKESKLVFSPECRILTSYYA